MIGVHQYLWKLAWHSCNMTANLNSRCVSYKILSSVTGFVATCGLKPTKRGLGIYVPMPGWGLGTIRIWKRPQIWDRYGENLIFSHLRNSLRSVTIFNSFFSRMPQTIQKCFSGWFLCAKVLAKHLQWPDLQIVHMASEIICGRT